MATALDVLLAVLQKAALNIEVESISQSYASNRTTSALGMKEMLTLPGEDNSTDTKNYYEKVWESI